MTDEDLAAALAEGAGRLLTALRDAGFPSGTAGGPVADKVANAFILTNLRTWRPEDGLLSEESPDDKARLERERVWIVDPLDGTREYSEGRDDWAVHVALAVGGRPALGAVALPARGLLFRSDRVAPPAERRPGRTRIAVSRTRPPEGAKAIAERLGAELVGIGSAGAKAMAVVTGEVDAYFHAGGQHEWDNCAPVAVALGAGLHASRADGGPLRYNQAETWVPDLLIAPGDLAAKILAWSSSNGSTNVRK